MGRGHKVERIPKADSPLLAPSDPIGYGHTRSCDREFGRARSPRSNLPSQGTAVWSPRTQCIPSRVTYHLSPPPMGLEWWVCCPSPPEGGLGGCVCLGLGGVSRMCVLRVRCSVKVAYTGVYGVRTYSGQMA